MKHIEIVQVPYKDVVSVTCDICKKRYFDEMELEEFIYIDFIGGYNSIFGDGSHILCDICQYCAKKLFGKNIQIDKF